MSGCGRLVLQGRVGSVQCKACQRAGVSRSRKILIFIFIYSKRLQKGSTVLPAYRRVAVVLFHEPSAGGSLQVIKKTHLLRFGKRLLSCLKC